MSYDLERALRRRDGKADMLAFNFPRRLTRYRVYREMNAAQGLVSADFERYAQALERSRANDYEGPDPKLTPTLEPDEHAASAIGYAVIGLCWSKETRLAGVPPRPGASLAEYGEAVADALWEAGYDVPSGEVGDLAAELYLAMRRGDMEDEEEEGAEADAAAQVFPEGPEQTD